MGTRAPSVASRTPADSPARCPRPSCARLAAGARPRPPGARARHPAVQPHGAVRRNLHAGHSKLGQVRGQVRRAGCRAAGSRWRWGGVALGRSGWRPVRRSPGTAGRLLAPNPCTAQRRAAPPPTHPQNPPRPSPLPLCPCREVKLDTTVTSYFHADGYLAEAKFRCGAANPLQPECVSRSPPAGRRHALCAADTAARSCVGGSCAAVQRRPCAAAPGPPAPQERCAEAAAPV